MYTASPHLTKAFAPVCACGSSAILSADLHSDGSLRDIKLAVLADLEGLSVVSYELRPGTVESTTGVLAVKPWQITTIKIE